MNKFIFALLTALSLSLGAEPNNTIVGEFSTGDLSPWESKSFKGETLYTLVEQDSGKVLKAESNAAASGLFREIRIDLERTPYLNWSWLIKNTLGGIDEQSKGGDDFPARVYVVVSGGIFFWRTKAINYVWSNNAVKESTWPNPFAGKNAMMVAIRTPTDKPGIWLKEKRNVRTDLKNLFGKDIRYIDAIAVMTDTDNSGRHAEALYGDIYFSSE